MAVQQRRKTPSRRGMRRAHDGLKGPTLSTDSTTGELHRRHHVSAEGFYRGRKVVETRDEEDEDSVIVRPPPGGRRTSRPLSMTTRDPITIALDAMGGDHGPSVVVPAALRALERHPQLHLTLVGDREVLEGYLPSGDRRLERLTIHHASQTVGMDEPPAQALRTKKDSSMRVAINLVREGVVSACVSAGNTGALMATARYVLKTLPGIDRPAIITAIPALQGHTHMLDLGANVDCSADHLAQFAAMGSILATAVDNVEHPRVGLLNVGAEQIKGNDQVKEAARLLANSDLNYIGYVEGNDISGDRADVIVCDGFVGNVALKTTEGVAKIISHYLRQEFRRTWVNRLIGLLALPILNKLKKRIDPRRYNGASLLGLQGIVIKSHGGADAVAFANAIDIAVIEVAKDVPSRIDQHLEHHLPQGTPA